MGFNRDTRRNWDWDCCLFCYFKRANAVSFKLDWVGCEYKYQPNEDCACTFEMMFTNEPPKSGEGHKPADQNGDLIKVNIHVAFPLLM